jgi:hypothetical protein
MSGVVGGRTAIGPPSEGVGRRGSLAYRRWRTFNHERHDPTSVVTARGRDPRPRSIGTDVSQTLHCCNGTYERHRDGWRYAWGDLVPNASDLTLADLMLVDDDVECAGSVDRFRPLTAAERRWLAGEHGAVDEVLLRRRNGRQPNAGDLIVGMLAPELHVLLMLTVGDIADAAGVSKATIDSYRYRGYLPEPQVTRGRTPLWSRPVVSRWLATRPGSGWRTDLYEAKGEHPRRRDIDLTALEGAGLAELR